jgi:hypothetical protein
MGRFHVLPLLRTASSGSIILELNVRMHVVEEEYDIISALKYFCLRTGFVYSSQLHIPVVAAFVARLCTDSPAR